MPLSEAKVQLSKIVSEVSSRDEQVTITKNGRPAAIVVSPDEFESWQATIEILRDPDFAASVRRGIRDLDEGRVIEEPELRELFGVPSARPPKARRRGRR